MLHSVAHQQDLCLEINELRFGYAPNSFIIDISHFSVKSGEKVFLYGPSGSGKSTFLNLVAGILSPVSGSLKVFHHEFAGMKQNKRDQVRGEEIGFIFQIFNLIPFLTVKENILLPLSFNEMKRKSKTNTEWFEQVLKYSKKLGVDSLLDRKAYELSVGQQQRVAAIRALIGEPRLVIADEPTSALDEENRESFLKLLFEMVDSINATLLFVSHEKSLNRLFDKNISLMELKKS